MQPGHPREPSSYRFYSFRRLAHTYQAQAAIFLIAFSYCHAGHGVDRIDFAGSGAWRFNIITAVQKPRLQRCSLYSSKQLGTDAYRSTAR